MTIKPLTHDKFVSDMNEFCRATGMAKSELGFQAINDRAFYLKVVRGNSPTLQRIERIYDFMVKYEISRERV